LRSAGNIAADEVGVAAFHVGAIHHTSTKN
jgi:hypothetical protein